MKLDKIKYFITRVAISPWFYPSLILSLAIFSEVEARVGGGHSYGGSRSSGSRSGGSGFGGSSYSGSGGDGRFLFDLIYWVLRLCFRYPLFGIPFLVFVIYLVFRFYKKSHAYDGYYSDYSSRAPTKLINHTREYIYDIQKYDKNFSYPLFKDFIFSLYSQFQELRGEKKLDLLSQYFSEGLIEKYNRHETLTNAEGVVIGNCQLQHLHINTEFITLQVFFTANYTEIYKDGKTQRFSLRETWKLKRSVKISSKPPEKILIISCPSCGAPITETTQGKCFSCGQSNKNGNFDWHIYEISTIKDFYMEARNSNALLAENIIEEGTKLPTVRDPMIDKTMTSLFKERAELEYARKRFVDIFMNLQKAWSTQKWELARPFESDPLFQSHHFWIEDYKRKKEKNIIDNISIERVVPVALYQDEYYLSFTVRIFASMIDYTQNQSGKIIMGSKNKKVQFSEYWTFIKGIGENHKAAKLRNISNCPSCGAELKVGMSGKCEYCGSKITLGQFDWVLSQIEQDEEFNL